ncbi:MAG: glycosyltransferase [Sciscionella sp.]
MKVLHVITGLGVGGAELQLRMLLQHTRHEAEVLTLYNPATVAEMIEADGVRVRNLRMTKNTELSALLRLRRIIRDGRYDIVHVHLYRACVYGRVAAKLAGTPVVVTTEHSIGETHIERRRMSPGVRALYLATDLCSHATIAVSEVVRSRLINWGVRADKIEVIPNGLAFDGLAFDPAGREAARDQFGIPRDAFVVGVLGRLDPYKRIDLAIQAAAPLLNEQCRMLIVGQGDDRARLEGVAASHGVSDGVVFAGYQADSTAMLSAIDLYVSSSEQETFGLSVLEALTNGMPALYTACPGLDGISTDRARRVAGTPEAFRAEIARAIGAEPQAREPVAAVRERYGIESVTGRIDELYERLARRERTGERASDIIPARSAA